jgi:hypothetical protein
LTGGRLIGRFDVENNAGSGTDGIKTIAHITLSKKRTHGPRCWDEVVRERKYVSGLYLKMTQKSTIITALVAIRPPGDQPLSHVLPGSPSLRREGS